MLLYLLPEHSKMTLEDDKTTLEGRNMTKVWHLVLRGQHLDFRESSNNLRNKHKFKFITRDYHEPIMNIYFYKVPANAYKNTTLFSAQGVNFYRLRALAPKTLIWRLFVAYLKAGVIDSDEIHRLTILQPWFSTYNVELFFCISWCSSQYLTTFSGRSWGRVNRIRICIW